jgi:hypothetical protein
MELIKGDFRTREISLFSVFFYKNGLISVKFF